jgi:hypothetical protein
VKGVRSNIQEYATNAGMGLLDIQADGSFKPLTQGVAENRS